MPLQIVRNDITKMECDAIVNAANSSLLGGGGVDGAIHRAAGKGLFLECIKLGGCKTGQAKITGAYNLPCKYIIHTVGPVWRGGSKNEKELLTLCYKNSLMLAKENKCQSVAFPLISSGIYGYPKDKALKVATDAIKEFISKNDDMLVYIVVFDKNSFNIGEQLFSDIESYIDDNYTESVSENKNTRFLCEDVAAPNYFEKTQDSPNRVMPKSKDKKRRIKKTDKSVGFNFTEKETSSSTSFDTVSNLEKMFESIDESFSEMLMRKIDENGMTDSECYKKANIDRKLFSKIRSDKFYKPSKQTAIAFAIALELSLDETKDMLMKAGFALSHSSKFDIIIEYFITKEIYDIYEINQALFAFDQKLLGL